MKQTVKQTTERRISAILRIALAVTLLLANIAAVFLLTAFLEANAAFVFAVMEIIAVAVAINIQSSTSCASSSTVFAEVTGAGVAGALSSDAAFV